MNEVLYSILSLSIAPMEETPVRRFDDLMYFYNADAYRVLRNSKHTRYLSDSTIHLIANHGRVKASAPMEDYSTHRYFSVTIELDGRLVDPGLASYCYEYTAIFATDIWSKMLALTGFMCSMTPNLPCTI
jgi:hypothetical protein